MKFKKRKKAEKWVPKHNGGPLVKQGPSTESARINVKEGKWRKKRSAAKEINEISHKEELK